MSRATEPPARVICVGNAVLDKVFRVPAIPDAPIKIFAESFVEVGGGPAANAAVAIARLGGNAALWSRVGRDPSGRNIIEGLQRENVDAAHVRAMEEGHSTVAAVLVDDAGERLIAAFNDPRMSGDTDWLPLHDVPQAGAVLADIRWPEGAGALFAAARAHGVPSVLDADLTPDADAYALVAHASHVIFSQPALAAYSGTGNVERGLLAAQAKTDGLVGVTLGGAGFHWLEDGRVQSVPAFAVPVVDTLGAGDVFHGAFALALAVGRGIEVAGRFACAAASLKCARPGGRNGIPYRAEVDDLIRGEGQRRD